MKVLNVGGGATRDLPKRYDGWGQILLDINPDVKPDICKDAKRLTELQEGVFDAVYCSHNLEHFYKHDVPLVLEGFLHVLNENGFAEISVPDVVALMVDMMSRNHDIGDVWYRTGEGTAITFHDVLYGWNAAMAQGNEYYAHKCGFTPISLAAALQAAGFKSIFISAHDKNITAIAYKKEGASCP